MSQKAYHMVFEPRTPYGGYSTGFGIYRRQVHKTEPNTRISENDQHKGAHMANLRHPVPHTTGILGNLHHNHRHVVMLGRITGERSHLGANILDYPHSRLSAMTLDGSH